MLSRIKERTEIRNAIKGTPIKKSENGIFFLFLTIKWKIVVNETSLEERTRKKKEGIRMSNTADAIVVIDLQKGYVLILHRYTN